MHLPRTKNFIGETFGKLTVLEPTDQRDGRYMVWKCRCACGNTVFVSSKKLQRGTVTSCGCDGRTVRKRGAPLIDLTGQRFGDLVVIRRAPSVNGKTMWLCRCDCGNEKVVSRQTLMNGTTIDCGCKRKERQRNKIKDLSGQRFGRLTAIEPTERRDVKGSVFWKCRCDCGNETEVDENSLTSGNTISCGCRKAEVQGRIQDALTFVDGTCIDHLRSRKSRSDNKSGFRGVYKTGDKYRVSIGFQKKRYYLGTYDTYEMAVGVRLQAEKELHERCIRLYDWWTQKARSDPGWAKEHPFTFHVEVKDKEVYATSPLFQAAKL